MGYRVEPCDARCRGIVEMDFEGAESGNSHLR